MGRVEGQGTKSSLNIGDGGPRVLVSTSKDVSERGHLEVRRRRRERVRRMAQRGRGVRNESKLTRLAWLRDKGYRDDPSRSRTNANLGTEEMTGRNFGIEVSAEGRSIFGGTRIIGEVEVLDDGTRSGNIQTVGEHGSEPVAFGLGGIELL